MADPARRRLTVDEFYGLPAEELEGGPELIDGELLRREHGGRHALTHARLARLLLAVDPSDYDASGWWLVTSVDWRLDQRNLLVPDLAGWRRERLPALPDGPVDIAPDWVCELVSPGHEKRDLKDKSRIYLQREVPWYWIGHPEAALLQVYRNAGPGWMLHGTYTRGDKARVPPFEEAELDLDRLFLPPAKNR